MGEKNLCCNVFSFGGQDMCLRVRLSSFNLACCLQQWVAISFCSKYSLLILFTWPFRPLEVFSQELVYCGAVVSLCMPVTSGFEYRLLDARQNGQHQQVQVGQTLHADYHSEYEREWSLIDSAFSNSTLDYMSTCSFRETARCPIYCLFQFYIYSCMHIYVHMYTYTYTYVHMYSHFCWNSNNFVLVINKEVPTQEKLYYGREYEESMYVVAEITVSRIGVGIAVVTPRCLCFCESSSLHFYSP